jgi:tRNA U55 pseudouridine synthase TruB
MKIYSYNIIDYTFPLLKIKFNVWSWTYIRSIGYRLGQQLNLWWALIQLERTKIWKIELDSIGENNSAKWNIKWTERTIYYKKVTLEEIWITPTLNEEVS